MEGPCKANGKTVGSKEPGAQNCRDCSRLPLRRGWEWGNHIHSPSRSGGYCPTPLLASCAPPHWLGHRHSLGECGCGVGHQPLGSLGFLCCRSARYSGGWLQGELLAVPLPSRVETTAVPAVSRPRVASAASLPWHGTRPASPAARPKGSSQER